MNRRAFLAWIASWRVMPRLILSLPTPRMVDRPTGIAINYLREYTIVPDRRPVRIDASVDTHGNLVWHERVWA